MWYDKYDIQIPNGKLSGQAYTICPKCSHTRKKKTDKCLGVDLTNERFHCNHCNWKGGSGVKLIDRPTELVYIKPEWSNKTQLSDNVVKWFESRSIRQNTLSKALITEGVEFMPQEAKECNTIQFNYFLKGVLTNIKYRTGNKHFKMFKGAELIPYNADAILKESDQNSSNSELFIVEGEIDCLSFIECGIENVISVPNGASLTNNNLSYLDRFTDELENISKIYIATDNDTAGRKLRNELAYRLGIEKCYYIEFKDGCKDANEALVKGGSTAIMEATLNAKPFPLEGIFTVNDFKIDVLDLKENGLQPGQATGMQTFDKKLTFMRGYFTVVTGIPGHGKSDFVDQVCMKLLINHHWKTAYFSPENRPTQVHISKLIRKIIGKHFNDCSIDEVNMCTQFLDKNVTFIEPEKEFNLDSILKKVLQVKRKYGLDNFVIDAWNRLEHLYDKSENESKYVGRMLLKLDRFCMVNNLHCFLVAHPAKLQKNKNGEMPTVDMYSISGSANFYNIPANGIGVTRNFDNNTVDIEILKVKFAHWGEVGTINLGYHKPSGRYVDTFDDFMPWIKYDKPVEIMQPTKMKPNLDFSQSTSELMNEVDNLDF